MIPLLARCREVQGVVPNSGRKFRTADDLKALAKSAGSASMTHPTTGTPAAFLLGRRTTGESCEGTSIGEHYLNTD